MVRRITTNKIKVLIVSCIYPDDYSSSEGIFVANWAEQLRDAGLDIRVYKREHLTLGSYLMSFSRVFKFYRHPRVYMYNWRGISVYRQAIHLRFPLDYSKSAPKITYKNMKPIIDQIYKQFPFDIVYLATWGDLSLTMSWIAKKMGIPYIASAIGDHTNLYYNKPDSIYFKYHREIFLGSELVICVSNDLKKKVKSMTQEKANTFTYYSGVDTKKFRPSIALRKDFRERIGYVEGDFVILFVGRQTEEKGIYELIEAFAQLLGKDHSLKLLLVGPLFRKIKLKNYISRHGINGSVKLTGSICHDEVPGYINACDVFVLPSWMEGLPNVVMEACACERPVVASAVGGIPEIIENNMTGFLVKPRSVSDLAERLAFVIGNPKLAIGVSKRARKEMIKKFNYHQNGRLFVSQIQKILEDKKI